MFSPLASSYSSSPHLYASKSTFMMFVKKNQRMERNEHQLNQYELVVPEVMGIHREGVFPSCYPCLEFMRSSGILRDFRTLVSNTGLSDF